MALAVMAALAVFSIAALAISCGGDSDGPPPERTDLSAAAPDIAPTETPVPQATPEEAVTAQASTPADAPPEPAPEPEPEAAPPENRANCNAIRGTEYRSLEERDWFGANCARIASLPSAPAASAGTSPRPAAPSGSQSPMGDRLIIPAAGVNTEVWRVRVSTSGVMPDPTGYFNALWYDFSALPGLGGNIDSGNIVLSGHVDCGKCYNGGAGAAVFWTVRNLKAGDTAQYRAADGRVVDYVVTSSHSLAGNTDGASLVASGAADMTLITCTGTFSGGEYSLRHVVTLRKA